MAKRESKKKEAPKAGNLHDAFFKNTFSYPEIVRAYISKFMDAALVQHINLDSLKLETTSFVTAQLSEYFSDLVWQAQYKATNIKISFLFEHKSYVVPHPHVQLMRYILEHFDAQIKAKQQPTVVVPIIIYHGENEWKVRPFSDYFAGVDEQLKRYIPNFEYNLTSLSDYSDEQLINMGIGKLVNVFLAMAHVRNIEYIVNNYETIFIFAEDDIQKNQYLQFFQTILVYLFNNTSINGEQLKAIVTTINQPLKKFTMSTYDLLIKEGIEKGREEGREEGIEQGIEQGVTLENFRKTQKVVLNLIAKFPTWRNEEIAELADTTVDFVEQIRGKLN